MADFEDNLIASPAIRRLEALMPGGLDGVDKSVRRALKDDDYSTALREANTRYARRGAQIYVAALTYACLLVGRELVVEARGVLEKALEVHGRDPALVALLADALVLEGDIERASRELATLDPQTLENPAIAGFVADVHLDLAEVDEAIACYQRAVDQGVDDPEPAIRLAQLYEGRDEMRPAVEAFEYAAKLAKNRVGLWQVTADMWFELGEARKGYQARRRLLELGGSGADPIDEANRVEEANKWLELGYGFAELGDLEDALEALTKAQNLDPIALEPLLIRGHVLLAMGRAEEAMAAFQKVEEQQKDHPTAQRGMAEAALLIGDLMLAETRAKRAVELAADDPEAHHIQGRVLQQFGRHERAIDAFRSALALEGEQAEYLASMALSLAALGQVDQATASLQGAVEIVAREPHQLPLLLEESAWHRLEQRLDADVWAEIEAKLDLLTGEEAGQ
jgi:tetratricopeptide (TPR) repeat protein